MSADERYKGHEQLIDAWPEVVAAVPEAQLIVVGDGDDATRLRARAAASHAADRMEFTGFVDRRTLEGLYADAAVFVLPSRGEGFGLVYLEAMAHGLPCVGSIHDAAREIVVDGATGLLVDSDRGEALGQAIVTLLRNDAMRRAFGRAGLDRLQQAFTFERFKARIVSLLESTVERAGR
jgi:phosphatidylinositol alpha-1,6-mannosyltransferase